jgi:hypothetical protein
MNREAAETYLRLLAEAELRRVTTALAVDHAARQRRAPRLALAAQALCAAGAVDAGTAAYIRAELDLALLARQLSRPGRPPRLMMETRTLRRMLDERDTAVLTQVRRARMLSEVAPAAPARVVPVGQVMPGYGRRGGDLLILAYAQDLTGARFVLASGMAGAPHPLTATDERGASYQLDLISGARTGMLELRPDPAHAIRWLNLIRAPGQAAIGIDLDPPAPPGPPPEITVTPAETSPGEILLDVIAASILTSTAASPPGTTSRPPAANQDLRALIADGPGNITAALHVADVLPPASPVPAQLAALCERLGIGGHGITAPPAADLPQPWQNMLTSYQTRQPRPPLAPGRLATAVASLPALDGVQLTVLGLHSEESGTILHVLASGVIPDDPWPYARGVKPLPSLWVHDSHGHWHTTRVSGSSQWKQSRTAMLWLTIAPPLDADATWIDLVATGPSAKAQVRLPLRWQ